MSGTDSEATAQTPSAEVSSATGTVVSDGAPHPPEGGEASTGAPSNALVRHAMGYDLYMSASNKTGYKGVSYDPARCPNKPYRAAGPQPEQRFLGSFETAVDAAVAYAKCVSLTPEDFELSKKHEAQFALFEAAAGLVQRGVAREVDGVELHLSTKSTTGYRGVSYKPLANSSRPYQAVGPQPEGKHLGYFTTAVDAARAYADFVRSPTQYKANEQRAAVAATETAMQALRERGIVTEARGYQLHLSTNNAKTGYLGVRFDKHHPTKPFKAEVQVRGQKRSLGYHATAVDAAIAYAKCLRGENQMVRLDALPGGDAAAGVAVAASEGRAAEAALSRSGAAACGTAPNAAASSAVAMAASGMAALVAGSVVASDPSAEEAASAEQSLAVVMPVETPDASGETSAGRAMASAAPATVPVEAALPVPVPVDAAAPVEGAAILVMLAMEPRTLAR